MKMNALVAGLALVLATGAPRAAEPGDRIANEGTIGDRWALAEGASLPAPVYPAHLAARGANVCLALGYRIGADGSTSGFRVLRQWNSEAGDEQPVEGFWEAFAQAAADAVSQWRFQPRPGIEPQPTYTVATLGFEGGREEGGAAVNAHCRITDLAARLAELDQGPARQLDPLRREQERQREAEHRALMNQIMSGSGKR